MGPGAALPEDRDIHVWFVELSASAPTVEACGRSLAADEQERASRFRFEHLKTGFTLGRGILRALLGRYLAIEPRRLRFAYGPRGKPCLAFPETPLAFNLAHSGKLAAYAFTSGCELGIDIEEVRQVPDQGNIVRRFFAPAEHAEWLAVDASRRNEAFFACWTRKEAYIKALGDGLSLPLDSFRVSLRPGEAAALLHTDADPAAPGKWSLHSFAPVDGYLGALAVPERGRAVRLLPPMTPAAALELADRPGGLHWKRRRHERRPGRAR